MTLKTGVKSGSTAKSAVTEASALIVMTHGGSGAGACP
jgi:hypothetical protein